MRIPDRKQIALLVLTLIGAREIPPSASAQQPAVKTAKAAPDFKEIELEVSPTPPTIPASRYRLIPREPDRTPGDAAPIYLRLSSEDNEEARRQLKAKPHDWLQLPFDRFPKVEARAFVDDFARRLKQLEYGSRRRSCDWNYTLPEQADHVYEIMLPDAQEMRIWGRLIALKARVEIAEGKFSEAGRTIETGLAFTRHIAEGPFSINALVAIAVGSQMLGRVDEWVGQPDAPNLYWSLTALPRPLVSVRHSLEQEQKMIDSFVPELDDLDRPRTEAEWKALLARLHARMAYARQIIAVGGARAETVDLSTFGASLLPDARAFIRMRHGKTDGFTDDQMIVLYVADRFRDLRDDLFKQSYLPFPDSFPFYLEANRRIASLKGGPLRVFEWIAPEQLASAVAAESRLDRKVAALRAIEAIRLQAHVDGGRLPESLAKVTTVPVPPDPSTGRPFDYRREGDVLILSGPDVGRFVQQIGYRIRLRR